MTYLLTRQSRHEVRLRAFSEDSHAEKAGRGPFSTHPPPLLLGRVNIITALRVELWRTIWFWKNGAHLFKTAGQESMKAQLESAGVEGRG